MKKDALSGRNRMEKVFSSRHGKARSVNCRIVPRTEKNGQDADESNIRPLTNAIGTMEEAGETQISVQGMTSR